MNENELRVEATKRADRVRDTAMTIVTYARGLLPVLKDAGREHSAKELDRLLFEHDAAVQDGCELVKNNYEAVVNSILKRPPQGR